MRRSCAECARLVVVGGRQRCGFEDEFLESRCKANDLNLFLKFIEPVKGRPLKFRELPRREQRVIVEEQKRNGEAKIFEVGE